MSFIGDLFTGKKTDKQVSTPVSAPQTYMPGYSFGSRTGYGGGASFNPGGSSVQVSAPTMQTLGRFGGLTNTALGRTGKLITDLKGNANPFINARIRPLQQNINERRMDLSRSMSQRGVQGSLANNELLKFDTAAQRELADQRALLTQDTLNSLYQAEGLDQSVRGEVLNLADGYLKTSLSELGLSLEGMRMALSGSERSANQNFIGAQKSVTSDRPSPIQMVGSLLSFGQGG